MMKILPILAIVVVLTAGCAQQPSYKLSAASKQINDIQILDPHAPERNDGIASTLDGNYGHKVIKGYINSAYEAKTGRDVEQQSSTGN